MAKSGSKASDVASLRPKHNKAGWVRGGSKGKYSVPGMPIRGK